MNTDTTLSLAEGLGFLYTSIVLTRVAQSARPSEAEFTIPPEEPRSRPAAVGGML